MTIDEAKKFLYDISYHIGNMGMEYLSEKDGIKMREAIDILSEALEQQPCEDCISREEVMKCFKKWQPYMATRLYDYEQELKALSSVNPSYNSIKTELKPSEDCISREAVLNLFNRSDGYIWETAWIRRKIEKLPPVTPQQKWIPCSKELPEEFLCDDGYVEPSDYVLVWGDHGNYGVSRYWGNRKTKTENPNSYKDWMDLDWVVQKPIAWMPLPEPYKAESEDEG